jgi:uncharacterized repeat protein (TIGR01451 family)
MLSVARTTAFRSRTSLAFLAMSLVMASVPRAAAAAEQPIQIATSTEADAVKGGDPAARPASFVARDADLAQAPAALLGPAQGPDAEPNNTTATATPISGTSAVIKGNIFPAADVDFFSFTATAGDRVFLSTMTTFSTGNSTDSQLTLLDTDGTTVIEFDDDSGIHAALASVIGGAIIPTTGTYFIKVNDFNVANVERPYDLYFRLQSGAPTPEVESNDTPATANPLPANGWVSGARNPAVATEQDWYSINLNAGDTVQLVLDLDPEDDFVVWNGRLGFALFGDATNQILPSDDAGTSDTGSTPPTPNRPAESFTFTVKTAGTYFAFVDSATPATGGPTATYSLSVTVFPAADEGVNCTTYTSTDVPKTIGPTNTLVSSVITVPGNPRIADIDVTVTLNHVLMTEVDARLRSPAGNDNGLFTDIGSNALTGQAQMDATYDDEAGLTPFYTALRNMQIKPELAYRLGWFDGENAGGTWTLDLRDDVNNANGGTLTGWSIRVCEPPPPPACAPGFTPQTVFSTDFESGAAGFTHSGTLDEWELGLPATLATTTANPPPVAPFNTCNSGVNCWKTDLDNTYELNSTQNLLSPPINLAGLSAPVVVTWAQRYQMESATFDHYFVDAQQVGGATPVRLFEWLDGTMTDAAGNPAVNTGASAGWGTFSRRADSLAGLNTELRFHVDGDNTVNLGGAAIDDVTVTACRPLAADLSITKTDGVTTATPGGSVTYTVTASNAGIDPVTGGTVADTFPASLTCTWTCVGAGGGTCTAAGSGNINDTVNLPTGGSVTYTASCSISAAATGTLSNTATVSSSVTDPNPANNSATDTDTLTPQADLGITKDDGVTTGLPGGSTTYTITAVNAGPSNAPGSTVADTFPASLTCNWTCVGAGGGTCTAAGAGNINDTVNLPAGGSVTYTAPCAIGASATGTLTNTATAAAPAGVTDPTPGNNSATDSDTLAGRADVAVTKTVNNATPTVGANVIYTVTATNNGPSDAHSVTVTDVLPNGLTFVAATPSAGSYAPGTGAWVIGTVADGATETLSITATVNSSQAIVNQASVTAQAEPDPDRSNNTGTVAINAPGLADLQLQETVDDDTPSNGQNVTFTVTARNAGPTGATNVVVTDNLPSGLTFVSATPSQGTYASATGTWTVGAIANGAAPTLQVVATVTSTSGITRVVQKTQTEADYASDNDTDSVTLNDNTVADLAMSLVASQEPVPQGTTFTYTIVVSNHGPAAATNVTVTDSLPAGLTFVSSATTQGSCTGTTNVGCNLGTLADGNSASIQIVVTKTVGGNVSNSASVAATEIDPFMPNNSNSETSTPAELTTFRVE